MFDNEYLTLFLYVLFLLVKTFPCYSYCFVLTRYFNFIGNFSATKTDGISGKSSIKALKIEKVAVGMKWQMKNQKESKSLRERLLNYKNASMHKVWEIQDRMNKFHGFRSFIGRRLFWVNFDHFSRELHFLRQLGQ